MFAPTSPHVTIIDDQHAESIRARLATELGDIIPKSHYSHYGDGNSAPKIDQFHPQEAKSGIFIMDLHLGEGRENQGIDYIKKLKKSNLPLRSLVIVYTAYQDKKREALKAGADYFFLKKPKAQDIKKDFEKIGEIIQKLVKSYSDKIHKAISLALSPQKTDLSGVMIQVLHTKLTPYQTDLYPSPSYNEWVYLFKKAITHKSTEKARWSIKEGYFEVESEQIRLASVDNLPTPNLKGLNIQLGFDKAHQQILFFAFGNSPFIYLQSLEQMEQVINAPIWEAPHFKTCSELIIANTLAYRYLADKERKELEPISRLVKLMSRPAARIFFLSIIYQQKFQETRDEEAATNSLKVFYDRGLPQILEIRKGRIERELAEDFEVHMSNWLISHDDQGIELFPKELLTNRGISQENDHFLYFGLESMENNFAPYIELADREM
ncbi:MAG: hypothetical protein AAF587_29240 [Bacteroidota bacterium]